MENPKYILLMRQVASDFDGISHELFQIANDLERIDQFNPQQKLFGLVRGAEVSTVSLRNLTARTVHDDVAPFYSEVADLLGIKIEESHDWIKITVPAILPKRNQRDNQAFLTRPLRYALLDFLKENPMERFGACAICIVHQYDEALGIRRIRDYDNIETKRYRAIREGYVKLFRKKHQRHVIRSLSLTEKGFDYVAQGDPEAWAMIHSRINNSDPVYPAWIDKILRLHAIATGTVMSNAAGAEILQSRKPSLMSPAKRTKNSIPPDPNSAYYFASHELRAAIEEYSPESVSKSSRTIGIIVKGNQCYFLYFTGSTRMYWMKNSEENYAAAIKSLLIARGFGVTTIHQVVIGSTMSVAQRLCHSAKPFGNKYFVVSTFFAQCVFLTNNADGDNLLKIILHPDMALKINQAMPAPYHPPRTPNREYDAIDVLLDRPVILNYQCDLLKLSDITPMPGGFRGSPIMLCFDYQAQTVQGIVGPSKINCKTQKKSPRVSRSLGTRGLRDFDENESKCMSMLASGEISQWFS